MSQVHAHPAAGNSCRSDGAVPGEFRTVNFNLSPPTAPTASPKKLKKSSPFPDNYVRSAKYTFYNFLVINLFEQFSRVANLYFLLIAVLQLIPGLSPTHWFTTVAPLLFVLLINAIKEIYDDYYRHKSDDEVNNRKVDVLKAGGQVEQVRWRNLMVGDVVRLYQNEEIPADLVFLASPDKDGLCYVETANLDGETNLKLKYCFQSTSKASTAEQLKKDLQGQHIECELPNERLYQFEGSVVGQDNRQRGLDVSNLLLRGCTIRKPDWIIGVVVFAGKDSKIQKNQTVLPRKVTQLERHMNILVILVFLVQVALSIGGAIGREVWLVNHSDDYYIQSKNEWPELGRGLSGAAVTVLRFIILLNQLIPISLYVTLEVVKVAQCLFLNWDREMYHNESDTPFVCKTTNLNEDLGQVEYVLSDKTGTLTQNVMGFVWSSISGELYGTHTGRTDNLIGLPNVPPQTPHTIALDATLRHIASRQPGSSPVDLKSQAQIDEFFINLAICNTVVPTVSSAGELVYQAESPDEEALVQGAAFLGYRLISRSTEKVEIEVHGTLLVFTILAVLEFNSDRKRMSILCETPDNTIRLYCKGADTMILKRLGPDQPHLKVTKLHLGQMAKGGFRTLAIGQRDISPEFYDSWQREFHKASVSLSNREQKIAKMANLIEKELLLIGATAVEDKLQDGVPLAIARMAQAGIKVWMLTGDKLETAVTISRSCNLFTETMDLVYLPETELRGSKKYIDMKLAEVQMLRKEQQERSDISSVGLVVEGGALSMALQPKHQEKFLDMCKNCRAVVCCRVSPIQKAQVTNLVKKKIKAVTLAIGDGANDVGMIQAAHIGVGISGREGRAAVLASDFAMAQFAYLARLLLVHGRWSYKRNAEVVLYAFYKNFAYCLANVYLNFFGAGFSSQPIYNSALIATYNMFWTSLPTMGFAILEQDVKASTMMAAPQLYKETMYENRKTFFITLSRWLLEAVWHSAMTFILPLYALWSAEPNGKLVGLDAAGVAIYTAVILTVNLKVVVRTQHWTIINFILIFVISMGAWFPFMYICSMLWQLYGFLPDMAGVAQRLFNVPSFWLSSVIAAPLISILFDIVLIAFENRFLPSDHRLYQEMEKAKVTDVDSGSPPVQEDTDPSPSFGQSSEILLSAGRLRGNKPHVV